MSDEASPAETAPAVRPLFREEAMVAHRRGNHLGSPLQIVPAWIRWSTRVAVLALVAGVVFAAFVRIGDFARGPAVIRMAGRTLLATHTAGSVVAIPVQPGQRVRQGATLVQLDDAPQRAELDRATHEYELLLARLLREPDDISLRKQLASLSVTVELARAHLQARTVRAPADGTVSDIRVRVGSQVQPGDAMVAIDSPDSRPVVVAMLPGHERPRLSVARGRMLLELDGFARHRVPVELRSIADEVVGPAEALRFLGNDKNGAVEIRGPVVMVEATIDSPEFEADGARYRFYDGMMGALEIEVDSETLLESVLPRVGDER